MNAGQNTVDQKNLNDTVNILDIIFHSPLYPLLYLSIHATTHAFIVQKQMIK